MKAGGRLDQALRRVAGREAVRARAAVVRARRAKENVVRVRGQRDRKRGDGHQQVMHELQRVENLLWKGRWVANGRREGKREGWRVRVTLS